MNTCLTRIGFSKGPIPAVVIDFLMRHTHQSRIVVGNRESLVVDSVQRSRLVKGPVKPYLSCNGEQTSCKLLRHVTVQSETIISEVLNYSVE